MIARLAEEAAMQTRGGRSSDTGAWAKGRRRGDRAVVVVLENSGNRDSMRGEPALLDNIEEWTQPTRPRWQEVQQK